MNTTSPNYKTTPDGYFEWKRPEILPFVPSDCHRLLDVGCGAGAFGESLKHTRKIEIWGVEPVSTAAEKASARLDHVVNGTFGPESALPAGAFDCIVFNDVLEHMITPEEALRYAKTLLSRGGIIIASIPNIQYFPILWQLAFHARWEYADLGVLDKTHLRFFTKSSLVKLFQSEGYSLESIRGINAYSGFPQASRRLWIPYKVVNGLFLGRFAEMKFPQFVVVAKVSL